MESLLKKRSHPFDNCYNDPYIRPQQIQNHFIPDKNESPKECEITKISPSTEAESTGNNSTDKNIDASTALEGDQEQQHHSSCAFFPDCVFKS